MEPPERTPAADAAAGRTALAVRGLHVHYGSSHVLQGVDLDVPARGITAVVGRNGAGKTTLVNAIMGLVPPTHGSVAVDGAELVGQPAYRRRAYGLAVVPQGRRLFRSLTVEEHLVLARPGRAGRAARDGVLATFPRLRERLKTPAGSLSGGEQSMLAIARALVLDPRILLMDEPTEGLAPLLVATLREVVAGLRSGGGPAILLVEQNLGFVVAVADRVAVMERGAIAQVLGPDEVSDSAALGALVLGGGPR